MRFKDLAKDIEKQTMSTLDVKTHTVFKEVLNEMDRLVPRDTGILAKNQQEKSTLLKISPFLYRLYFQAITPYARKVYYVTAKTGKLKWIEVAVSRKDNDIKKILGGNR